MKIIDYLIVANLMSGKGETERRLQEVKMIVNGRDNSCETIEIREPQRISRIILSDTRINKGVICIGGDGTFSETVGLMINNNLNVPLRIIPTGTANIIGNTLGVRGYGGGEGSVTVNSMSGIDGVKGGEGFDNIRTVDVGVAEYGDGKEYFLLGIGLGFEEKFVELAKKGLKTRFGVFSYIFTAIRELAAIKPVSLMINNGNKALGVRVALLVAFNLQPRILKAFPLFPFTKIIGSDSTVNVFYVEYHNKLQAIAGTLLFHILGSFNFGMVKQITTNAISISSPIPCRTQIDGEIRDELPVKLKVIPQKLQIITGDE